MFIIVEYKSHHFFFHKNTIPVITNNTNDSLPLAEYDQIAIFETRGYGNVYHNTEWILNHIRYAQNITQLPIVVILMNNSF